MISNSSMVFPLVSGSKKKAHTVARSIHPAKKNHTPYASDSKMYGSALASTNCVNHWQRAAHVPVKLRRPAGKISADTIHGIPFKPKDQLCSC